MQSIYFQYFLFISDVTVMSLRHSAYQRACSHGTDSKIVTDILAVDKGKLSRVERGSVFVCIHSVV